LTTEVVGESTGFGAETLNPANAWRANWAPVIRGAAAAA
jgi:hypothetical protein